MPSVSASTNLLRAGGRLSALIGFFAVAAIAGTLIACIVLPGVAYAGSTATKQIDAFQSLPSSLSITPLDQKSRLYAKDGKKQVLLASFFDQDRDVLTWDQVPQTVKNATLAAEDVRFYQHGPIDPNGIARALVTNARGGRVSGASTISQQYVKNVCIQQSEAMPTSSKTLEQKAAAAYKVCTDETFNRKLHEMRYAIGLEKKYSKNQILLGYLNIAGFGGREYGIEAASHYYYDESAKDLSIGQAATLMSIVNNPSAFRLDVKKNLAGAKVRRDYVLDTELKYGMISQADHDSAEAAAITVKITHPSTGCQTAGDAGFFCTYVVNTILSNKLFGKDYTSRLAALNTKGWKIYTTLDLDLEKKAQEAVNHYVPQTPGSADVGAATVSLQVGTGRVLSMVQNKVFKPNGAKNRTRYSAVNYNVDQGLGAGAGFQPGSTFKAFTLLGWLKTGHTINQVVNGDGRTIPLQNFTACGSPYGYGPYQFKNDDPLVDKGNMSVQEGTARSVNGVFMSLAEEQDLCTLGKIAESMGVHDGTTDGKLQVKPAMAIGTASSVAPLDMAVGYSTIANKGVRCDAVGIDRIVGSDGKSVKTPSADCRRVQDQQLVIAAGYDLHNPTVGGGTMAVDQLNDGHFTMGKTGTTDFAKDTWTMGSTTKTTTAVWVGNVTGHANLREYLSPHGCNAGSYFANMRHCIFQAIEHVTDPRYGGAASWPYPAAQYVSGGRAIVHEDAQPKAAPAKPKPAATSTTKGDDKSTGGDGKNGDTDKGGTGGGKSGTPKH